ncbi:MAG: 5-bromo-4-chloroindolyl phosphate hydrolysis family protein [Spirochaetes bacterium]|nr:5-bromo-4-chloroindolyl phosphate hydrolysis family protein [Spirochaetota bacterium]
MPKKEFTVTGNVISGIIGGLIFFLLLFFLRSFPFALIMAILIFIAGLIIFRKNKTEINFHLEGIKEEELRKTVKEGLDKVKEMRVISLKIKDKNVREKVDDIFNIVEKIFDDFKKDPADIKTSRQFLNYYLDSTIKIIKKYIEISDQNINSETVRLTLSRTERLLDSIKIAFEKQLSHLLQNDILDLDSEVEVLEKTLKMEGLGD